MGFQVSCRLGRADVVTLCNTVVGFAAGVVAISDLRLAARILLVAVIIDALDGLIARSTESSNVGPLLDSITDVISFGMTPSLFVYILLSGALDATLSDPVLYMAVVLVSSLYAVFSVLRTAFYTVYIEGSDERPGMANTLGAILLGTAYLSGVTDPFAIAIGMAVLSVLQVAPIAYPKPSARIAVPMGVVMTGAACLPLLYERIAPRLMFGIAVLFLLAGPKSESLH
jgi:CDP-diacylglycerol--serine O-phosphatidyltransferase